jgi:hypothetical protein
MERLGAAISGATFAMIVLERAGPESFYSLEGNMCGIDMRDAVALPGSKATSRVKGSHRKLGGLVSGRQCRVRGTVRIGKARSRSR